jgi:hypothetical protein
VVRVRVTRSLVLCVCFVDRCLSIVLFLLAIVLSVFRFTDSNYPFGVFKLFLNINIVLTTTVPVHSFITQGSKYDGDIRGRFVRLLDLAMDSVHIITTVVMAMARCTRCNFMFVRRVGGFLIDSSTNNNNRHDIEMKYC